MASFLTGVRVNSGHLVLLSTEDRQIIEPIHEWMIAAEPSLTGESSSVSLACTRWVQQTASPSSAFMALAGP